MQSTTTMRFAGGLLRVLVILNIVCLLLFATIGLGSFLIEERLLRTLTENGISDPASRLAGMRLALLLGGLAVLPAHLLLTRLQRMVASVGAGEAFAPVNAVRLKRIAWALLALQFLDLAFAWLSFRFDESFSWTPSVTGWLAVLLLFVLAQVFEQGAAMREELDATV